MSAIETICIKILFFYAEVFFSLHYSVLGNINAFSDITSSFHFKFSEKQTNNVFPHPTCAIESFNYFIFLEVGGCWRLISSLSLANSATQHWFEAVEFVQTSDHYRILLVKIFKRERRANFWLEITEREKKMSWIADLKTVWCFQKLL